MVSKNSEAPKAATNEASDLPVNRGATDMDSIAKVNSDFTIFKFGNDAIRVVLKDGEPWFVAEDVCKALKLSNPSMSLKSLDDDERSKFNLGRQGEANIISESGMFTLVLRCRDAVNYGSIPHQFRKWVTGEVLPSIRKTGGYKQTGKQMVETADSCVKAADLLFKLNLICTTWDAACHEISRFDPQMATRLNSTMGLFSVYTAHLKGLARTKQLMMLN